jgi:hypothetical protein
MNPMSLYLILALSRTLLTPCHWDLYHQQSLKFFISAYCVHIDTWGSKYVSLCSRPWHPDLNIYVFWLQTGRNVSILVSLVQYWHPILYSNPLGSILTSEFLYHSLVKFEVSNTSIMNLIKFPRYNNSTLCSIIASEV